MRGLLVAAGLCVGANAWAAEGYEIYSNDFSTKDQTDFATWLGTGKKPSGFSYVQLGRNGSFSIETGALVHTPATGKANSNVYNGEFGTFTETITTATSTTNYVLSFDVTLNYAAHQASNTIFEISDESKKTVICLYATHTRTNSTAGATSYGYIVGGDNAFVMAEGQGKLTNAEGYFGNGTKHEMANVSGTTGSKTYHVILDAQTNGLAKLTIKEGETTVVDEEDVNISASKGLKYMYLADYNSWQSTVSTITIDNFSIVEGAASTAATADYTVKYVATIDDVETEIKAQAVRTGIVDATVSLLDEDKNVIWYNAKKYVYSSDNASSSTIADDNSTVVKVVFTEAPSYTYSVVDNLGNTLASGSAFSGENVDFYVPYYVFKDGKFYKSPSLSSGSLAYAKSTISNISANTEITVTYTEEENTNVVFFSEAENLTDVSSVEDAYTQIRMSNGKAGYYTAQTAFVTLPAGVYTLTTSTRVGTTRFYAGNVGEGTEIASVSSSGSVETPTSDPFTLTEETDIYTSTGSTSAYFDYVIIRKTADLPSTEKIQVTSAGLATYVSNYNLDFSEATTKAYKVNVAEKGVATLTEVSKVPAKTPVLLYCEGGNGEGENIAVTTDAVDAVTGNDLVAGAGAAVATVDGDYTNMILNNVESKIGFYFANDQTVAANRAYLHIATELAPDAASAAGMTLVFADEATGINAIDNGQLTMDNCYYNLSGQRVSQPQKGLYIVNGKKYITK